MQSEIIRLREALQKIVDYQPPHHTWNGSGECSDCRESRDRQWPPSGLCDIHYREKSKVDDKNIHEYSFQHWTLRDIAKDALRPRADEGEK